jgi:hypothetical protein
MALRCRLTGQKVGIMLSSSPMSGETTPPDKLKQLRARVDSAATTAERVEATFALANELWLSDPVAARPLLEQVLAEADAECAPNCYC